MHSVYKVLTQVEYASYLKQQSFAGSEHDIKDGFIHLSTQTQVQRILEKYFSKETKVYVLEVDLNYYTDNIKWEPNSAGDLYPHLYNKPMVKEAVISVETKDI